MAVELVHAKMERGLDMAETPVYQITFMFGSPFTDDKGNHIGGATPVHMSFVNGMPPEDFVTGLRMLADHVETEFEPSAVDRQLKLVEDNDGD